MSASRRPSAPPGFSKRDWKWLRRQRIEARQRKRNRLIAECNRRLRILDLVLSGFAAESPIPIVESRPADA